MKTNNFHLTIYKMIYGLDADVFHCLMESMINDTPCSSKNCFNAIQANGHIALDAGGFIKSQWEQTSGATARLFVSDWITNRILDGSIKEYNVKAETVVKNALIQMGVPRGDAKNVALLVSAGADIFFTNDIDLFDPSRKNNVTDRQFASLVINRKGKVCKFCEKSYNLEIWHMAAMESIAA